MSKKSFNYKLLNSDSFKIKFIANDETLNHYSNAFKRLRALSNLLNKVSNLCFKVHEVYNYEFVISHKTNKLHVSYVELNILETEKFDVDKAIRRLAASKDLQKEDERLILQFTICNLNGQPISTNNYYVNRLVSAHKTAFDSTSKDNQAWIKIVLEVTEMR